VLYLDSSALIKRYVKELGTERMAALLALETSAGRAVFTSVVTYTEVHRALARRMKERSLSRPAFFLARRACEEDWLYGLAAIELGSSIFGFIPDIVEKYPLKSSDSVHLAAALWLRDSFRLSAKMGPKGSEVSFVTSDQTLEIAAASSGLVVINPERDP
jgi:predicted nucleic acid-binding protein